MKHKRNRARRTEARSEEKLRGRIRELEKEIDRLKRQLGSFKKHGKNPPAQNNDKNVNDYDTEDKLLSCPSCGSPDYKSVTIWTPKGYINWMICQTCKHREKKESDS